MIDFQTVSLPYNCNNQSWFDQPIQPIIELICLSYPVCKLQISKKKSLKILFQGSVAKCSTTKIESCYKLNLIQNLNL